MKKLQQVLMLAVCLLILMVAAVQRDGKLWGNSLKAAKADKPEDCKNRHDAYAR